MAEGHRRRLINKVFQYGIDILCEHEYLELCLFSVYKRKDTNGLAHALINKFGNLNNLCNAPIEEITKVEGIGASAAEHIKLIPYISKGYALHTTVRNKDKFTDYGRICERCVSLLKNNINEVAYVLCFDNSRHLIKEVKVAEGMPGFLNIQPRKIMDAIASTSTSSIILCHNHPSGILIPSQEDINTTKTISDFMETIGIEFIDHIIIADNKYISCKVI